MIGDTLKKLREIKGISRQEVSDKIGVTKRTLESYEYGNREPNIEVINKFADFYGVTTDYLLGRTETKPDPVELLTSMEDEQKLIKAYFSLPPQLRANFLQSLLEALREQEETNITVTQNPTPAIARSSDGDFKPAPTEEQFESFEKCPDDMID